MIKSLTLFILTFSIFNVYSQYELDQADFTPVINADSLSEILLNEFVEEFNKDSINYSRLLKNNYTYLTVIQGNNGRTFLNTGFNENFNRFTLNDEDAIEAAINRNKEFQRIYKVQKKTILKQKKKFGPIRSENFTLIKTTWISGTFDGFDKSIFLSFKNKNQNTKLVEVNFAVFFYDNADKKFFSVTNVK
jgi:hypothetical protein